MVLGSANVGGYYPTSERVLSTVEAAREACGDLFNCQPDEVTFGHNATTLVMHLAHALKHELRPGGNIVLSRLEHDTNAGPWVRMAEEAGAEVRWLPVVGPDCVLDMATLPSLLDERTQFVAVGYGSNSVGTINDVAAVCAAAKAVGAWSFVDAVHYAPHGLLDVANIGCDFMVRPFRSPHPVQPSPPTRQAEARACHGPSAHRVGETGRGVRGQGGRSM